MSISAGCASYRPRADDAQIACGNRLPLSSTTIGRHCISAVTAAEYAGNNAGKTSAAFLMAT